MKNTILIFLIAICGVTKAQFVKLHDFGIGTDGGTVFGDLISDGTFLYGMTTSGGTQGSYGAGVIFKIKPDGTGYDTLHNFIGTDGANPNGSLIFDSTKTFLYGMTQTGGANGVNPSMGETGYGVIFKIKPDGSNFDTLISFNGVKGSQPYGSLTFVGNKLYGMTFAGGTYNYGVVFKINPDGTGFDTLKCFSDVNARYPQGSLISVGNFLYGMTGTVGGAYGNIFRIKPDGTGYADLHDFGTGLDLGFPHGSLTSDGTFLYGMASFGGTGNCSGNGCGYIFKIKPDGTAYDTLFNFNGTNGAAPEGSLYFDGTYLFGMTSSGGVDSIGGNGIGNIFKIKPDGTGFDTLMSLNTVTGYGPYGSLISDGTCLYGLTQEGGLSSSYPSGTIFKYCFSTTGIERPQNNEQISFYPNPASDQFFIETNTADKLNLDLYDINGRHVFSKIVSDKENINAATLDNGVYTLTIKKADRIINKKLVILH